VAGTSGIAVWAEGIKADLRQRLPGQRKTQRDKLSLLIATMLHVRSANLVELASGLPRQSDRWDMGYQWISRFLANDLVSCDAVMQPFASEILARLAETGDPVPLILDQSKVSERHQVLMLSVRWGERALPVAWRVEETDGAIGFAVQKGLLDAVRGWLPAETAVTLHGDRFYGTPDLIKWCQDHGWDYRLRLKGNLLVWPDAERPSGVGPRKATTGDLALSGVRYFQDVALTSRRVGTNIGIIHDAGHAEPCEIAERFARDRRHVGRAVLPQHAGLFAPLGHRAHVLRLQVARVRHPRHAHPVSRPPRAFDPCDVARPLLGRVDWNVGRGREPDAERKKIRAAIQKARQKQALLVHTRTSQSCQAYAPSPAAAKALGVPAKLIDGEPEGPATRKPTLAYCTQYYRSG